MADPTLLYITRFSFLGKSGWRGPASTSPELLFAPDRLEARFGLFESLTLRSLADQTDPDFRHLVLSSSLMPRPYRLRLVELCADMLGDRAEVIFRKPGSAHMRLRSHIRGAFADHALLAQIVLDDDDAVARDFTGLCRREAAFAWEGRDAGARLVFVSFADGLSLILGDGAPWVTGRHVPYTNLGLTLVAPPGTAKTVLGVSHLKVGTRHASRVITARRPFYVRTVHAGNDSRAQHRPDPLSPAELAGQIAHFPCLAGLLGRTGAPSPEPACDASTLAERPAAS